MILWHLLSYISLSSAIHCFAGKHEFLQANVTLDRHDCPERTSCFVYIHATPNMTESTNGTDVVEMDAVVERGCLEEYEVHEFMGQIQCKQLLNLQTRLTASELVNGQRCACITDFCNTGNVYSLGFLLAAMLIKANW